MRTKYEALAKPRARDVWETCMIRRTVLSKRHGNVGVRTVAGGRQTTIELMELWKFARWASKAEYKVMEKPNR